MTFAIRLNDLKSEREIAKICLKDKADNYINPKVSFIGINGIKKLAKELPNWEKELGVEETKKIVKNMVDFMGTVPQTPNILKGIDEPDNIIFMAGRDKFSKVLMALGNKYNITELNEASNLFNESGIKFKELFDIFINYLLNNQIDYDLTSNILLEIGKIEVEAYKLIERAVDKI